MQPSALRAGAERLSRHLYDVVKLAVTEHGAALADREVLADVVKHKKVFYNAGYSRYDECLAGGLRLIPDDADLTALEADYRAMVASGMFYGDPRPFADLLDALRALEALINTEGTSS